MKNIDKLQLKKGDYCILLGIAIIVVVLLILINGNSQGNQVYVTVKGKTTTYSLFENQTIALTDNEENDPKVSALFVTNQIVIDNGQVYMERADCPDQVCVKHKAISKNGEVIICLPNQVYIEVESDAENDVDN